MAWSDWLTSDETRQLLSRYPGSLDEIAVAAMQDSRYAAEFVRFRARILTYEEHRGFHDSPGNVGAAHPPEAFPRVIVSKRNERAFATLVAAAMLGADSAPDESKADRPTAGGKHGDRRAPGRIPTQLVENAVKLREEEGLGRRRLAKSLPGLTEYQAGQILGWYRIGKPGGLWLEDGRLKWSAAISTTRDGVRLPRL